MPNALLRSLGLVNVVASSDNAAGASSAPNAPWNARAVASMANDVRGAADRRRDREADQTDQERALAAEDVGDPAAEQQEAAEGQRVGRDDPLPVVVGEVQRVLRGGQRDVHDRRVQHDHELRDAQHGKDEPATGVVRVATGYGSRAAGVPVSPRLIVGRTDRAIHGRRHSSPSRTRGISSTYPGERIASREISSTFALHFRCDLDRFPLRRPAPAPPTMPANARFAGTPNATGNAS